MVNVQNVVVRKSATVITRHSSPAGQVRRATAAERVNPPDGSVEPNAYVACAFYALPPELHAQRLAQDAAATLGAAGLKTSAVGKEGEAARCLVNEAADYGADCIFVGARGLGRVERFSAGKGIFKRRDASIVLGRGRPSLTLTESTADTED